MIYREKNVIDNKLSHRERHDGLRLHHRHLHGRFRGSLFVLISCVEAQIAQLYLRRPPDRAFTAEEIALSLGYRPHVIRQALHRLNVARKVLQPLHRPPHDSSRDRWGPPGASGWMANLYFLRHRPDPAP